VSYSHTIAGNAILVGASLYGPGTTSVTVGGVTATPLYSLEYDGSASTLWVAVYGLLNPPKGAKTVQITSAGAQIAVGSVSYFNAGSFGSPTPNTGAGTTASQSISQLSGRMVFQALSGNFGSSSFSSYSQTVRSNQAASAGTNLPLLIGDAGSSGALTLSATQPGSVTWGGILIPVLPPPRPALLSR
jgi:hypothetical protein